MSGASALSRQWRVGANNKSARRFLAAASVAALASITLSAARAQEQSTSQPPQTTQPPEATQPQQAQPNEQLPPISVTAPEVKRRTGTTAPSRRAARTTQKPNPQV